MNNNRHLFNNSKMRYFRGGQFLAQLSKGTTLRAFGVADYRWLWGENLAISAARFSIILIAGWVSYSFMHSVLGSSLVAFLGFAPQILFGPIIGMYADKLDKRLLIKVGAAHGAIVSLVAVIASVLGVFNLVLSLALALSAGLAFTFETPSRNSLLPNLIEEKRNLLNAYSWTRVATQGSEFVGPAITTVVLVGFGVTLALVIPAVLYCLSLFQAFMIKSSSRESLPNKVVPLSPRAKDKDRESIPKMSELSAATTIEVGPGAKRSTLIEGFAYVRHERAVSILILLVGFHCTLTMAYTGLLPSFSVSSLRGGDGVYGLLLTAVGLGAIVWSIGLARFANAVNENHLLIATGILSGLTLSFLALTNSPNLAYIFAFFVGGTQATFMSVFQSNSQALSRPEMRGRVAGVSLFFTAGLMGFSGLAQGFLALVIGTQLVMIVTSLAFVVIIVTMWRILPDLRMKYD